MEQEMPDATDYLSKISNLLSDALLSDMMHVAKLLRTAHDYDASLFPVIAEAAGIKKRRAYALARIARKFDGLGFSDDRLNAIGWAKLSVVARYIDPQNACDLVILAETLKAHELEKHLTGDLVVDGAKAMLFRLAPEQDLRLRKLLLANGAKGTLSGMKDKEKALIRLMNLLEGQAI